MKSRFHVVAGPATAGLMALGLSACAVHPAKEVVATREAPAAIGPYSQAIRFGNLLFLSGQIPLDPASGRLIAGSIEEQTTRVLENLRAVLAANGMALDDVVSTSVYLRDLDDFTRMNAVYATYFRDRPPARATVQVSRLPRDALVEISAVAAK